MSPFLKKSFNSAKCKTVLQLTGQKLKILRNKHGLSVKSLRANVATLLEKGQDSSAKTQAESVFREEKIVALYNLLEQFCQLVISRLESIKSQRECPSDLIEAVASLIYAASRCGEIEELKKLSSYLTNKYGTEFSLAAKELRSGCGVNTQVIQNLSSLPLSSDARLKMLKDVAVEYKINWDYDSAFAETSKQPADSRDGSNHPMSETQASNSSFVDRQSIVHVNEVNGQASGVSKTALCSHTLSPMTSLDSQFHNMNQPAKDNLNLETKEVCSSLRVKKLSASTLDPYALAKSQGRMDYKFVSGYKGREQMIEEHLTSTKSVKVTQSSGQSRSPRGSKMPTKQMSTAGRQEVETQLLELEAVAKIALEAAAEAAEAARAAVTVVRKESSGWLEGKISPSSSASVLDESVGDVLRFSPSSNNSGSDHTLEDVQQSSSSQQSSSQIQDSAKLNTIISVWDEERSTKVTASPPIENFYSTDEKEEVDRKSSHGQEEEGFFVKKIIQHDKAVQNFPSVPQFDDYSSEEAGEEETPSYASRNASSKQQRGNIFGVAEVQSDKDVHQEISVPRFDDDSCEEGSEEERPFYLKGRAAMVKKDYADRMARATSSKLMSASPLTDDMLEGSSSTNLEDIKEEVNLHGNRQKEPLDRFTTTSEPNFMEEHSGHSLNFPATKSINNISRSQIEIMNGGPGTRSYLDSSNDNSSSLLRAVTPFSPTGGLSDFEGEDLSSQVRRNLNWSSTISENSDVASVSSSASYKPSPLEDTSFKSSNSSLRLENGPRVSKPEFELPSQSKYKGMSRRSVRSSRPRQTENNPSPWLDR